MSDGQSRTPGFKPSGEQSTGYQVTARKKGGRRTSVPSSRVGKSVATESAASDDRAVGPAWRDQGRNQ